MKSECNQNAANTPKSYNLPNAETLIDALKRVHPEVFSMEFPSPERDATFTGDVTLSAFFYLGAAFPKHYVPIEESRKAFVYGYVCALHKSHTLHPALFAGEQDRTRSIEQDVHHEYDKLLGVGLGYPAEMYLINSRKAAQISASILQAAFLAGYQSAMICNGRYDRSLFMRDHELCNEVLASIISFRQHEENARRATARIVVAACSTGFDQFPTVLDPKDAIDDAGNPVTIDRGQDIPERFAAGVASDAPAEKILYVAPEIQEAVDQAHTNDKTVLRDNYIS